MDFCFDDWAETQVSNPISGEVGAAARNTFLRLPHGSPSFKPHQRGGGCCSARWETSPRDLLELVSNPISGEVGAAADSVKIGNMYIQAQFQTPSAGRWVLQLNALAEVAPHAGKFQTPSAGRWVLQPAEAMAALREAADVSNPISGEVGAAARKLRRTQRRRLQGFKPHQRGGGCCSEKVFIEKFLARIQFQTPSAGRWVLQLRRI